jgi:hypothetical protein
MVIIKSCEFPFNDKEGMEAWETRLLIQAATAVKQVSFVGLEWV